MGNVISFSQFDDEDKGKRGKKNKEQEPKVLTPEQIARQEKIEKEILKLNKRYRNFSKSLKNSTSDTQSNLKVLKYCLKSTINLLPMSEEIYVRYRNERAAYAYASLTSQARELMNDIRMQSSNEKTVEYMLNNVVLPSLQLVLGHISNDFSEIKTLLVEQLPPKKAKTARNKLNKMLQGHGQLLSEMSKSVEAKVTEYFK
jgi:hypothetical protein